MSQANLRNIANNPFLYLETINGSTAIGTDASGADDIVKIVTGLTSNIDPTSADGSISIETTTPGDIQFRPNGAGQTTFVNGDVEISAGNLLMQDTNVGATEGVISFGGNRFIHNRGDDNTFIGENSGSTSDISDSTVAVGANTLQNQNNLTGMTAVGFNALNALTNGIQNTAIGYRALESVVNANQNTAVGYQTLTALTSPGTGGGLNAAFGNAALRASTIGRFNTAIGCQALVNLNGNGSNDIFNTAVGCEAGDLMTSGARNTLVGAEAAYNEATGLLTGSDNILLGYRGGGSFTGSESSNIVIGNSGTAADNNKIRIGTQGAGAGQQNQCFIAGINGTSVTAAGTVVVSSSGQLGSISSTPFSWSQVTGTTQSAAANSGYIANNAGTVTVTLLAAASAGIGTELRVTGMNNATGWVIAQNASQQIFFEGSTTTAGVTGSLACTGTRNSVHLVCITADGLFWNVIDSTGNITVT